MARITIEDCIEQVPNRFHLVQMTAIRAKQLKKGATPLVQAEENKAVVTALREIAAGLVSPDYPDENASAAEAEVTTAEAEVSPELTEAMELFRPVEPSESAAAPETGEDKPAESTEPQ